MLENDTLCRADDTKEQQNSKTPRLCISLRRGQSGPGESVKERQELGCQLQWLWVYSLFRLHGLVFTVILFYFGEKSRKDKKVGRNIQLPLKFDVFPSSHFLFLSQVCVCFIYILVFCYKYSINLWPYPWRGLCSILEQIALHRFYIPFFFRFYILLQMFSLFLIAPWRIYLAVNHIIYFRRCLYGRSSHFISGKREMKIFEGGNSFC